MKEITTIKYMCEVCKTEYRHKALAMYCEVAPKLKPCPVAVGDKVWVYQRYKYGDELYNKVVRIFNKGDEDFGSDVVLGISIQSTSIMGILNDIFDEEAMEDCLREGFNNEPTYSHEWIITLKNGTRLGDGESFTNQVPLECLQLSNYWMKYSEDDIYSNYWLRSEYETS